MFGRTDGRTDGMFNVNYLPIKINRRRRRREIQLFIMLCVRNYFSFVCMCVHGFLHGCVRHCRRTHDRGYTINYVQ